MTQERGTKNIAVSKDKHEMLRELSYKQRRPVREIADEIINAYYEKQIKEELIAA